MAHGPRCARSVRHDLGPNIFPSGPPTQSISTYYSSARRFYSSMGVVLGRSRCEWLKNVTNIYAQFIGNFIKLYGRNHYESNSPHSSYVYFGVVLRPGHTRRQVAATGLCEKLLRVYFLQNKSLLHEACSVQTQ